jgi:hypothetical protein
MFRQQTVSCMTTTRHTIAQPYHNISHQQQLALHGTSYALINIFTPIIIMAVDDELPWTTSRCNRLLRPLSSKLAILRRDFERPRSTGTELRNVSTAFATKCSPKKTTNFTRPAHKPRGFEKATDPDWRPGAKPGAAKKTYGGRAARKIAEIQRNAATQHVSRPGEIAFTPLIARMGSQLHSSPQTHNSPLKRYGKTRGPLTVDLDTLQASGDPHKLVQGLLEAYANVLQVTTDGEEKRWSGTRSLKGACLRKLPAYIELEEHFAKLDKEAEDEDGTLVAEIYEELETHFEQRVGQGWRPFKQVVRAHATSLLCDAVTEGMLDVSSLAVLVLHCVNVSAWDEAERLLISYVPLLESVPLPQNLKADLFNGQKFPYLSVVKRFVDRTGRHRFLFDIVEHMIAKELFPLEWLATECIRPMWDRLARSCSDNDHRSIAHAFQFFETVTIAGMGLPDQRLLEDEATGGSRQIVPSSREELRQALDTTFSSLYTVLCSIALVNNGRDDDAGRGIARRITWMLDGLVLAISGRQDIETEVQLLGADPEDVQKFAQRGLWAIFASFLAHLDGCHIDSTTVLLDPADLIRCITQVTGQYSSSRIDIISLLGTLPTLITSIARGTGRIWKDDGFDQLQRFVHSLMALSGCRLPHKLWTLKRLALEAAMEFAQTTGAPQHSAFARDIEKKMRTQGRLIIVPSPHKDDSPSTSGGFKWEEGIGEWVACTPFVKQGVKRVARKPVPVLDLLPTPVHSEDEVDNVLPNSNGNDSMMWETAELDNDDDGVPHSSPIKKHPRTSTSSLGKRQRATSPNVIIPIKRTRWTPPDSPIPFYPDIPEEALPARRPRRSATGAKSLQSKRSRTSIESGLRHQQRKTYIEPPQYVDEDMSDVDNSADETSASSPLSDEHIVIRTTSVATSRTSSSMTQLDSDIDARTSRSHTRTSKRNASTTHSEPTTSADERDELGLTPARQKPQRSRRPATWWKTKRKSVVADSDDDDGSADELSFH